MGPPPEDRDTLLAAVRAAERLRLMVDALLDFSGAEARTLAPDRRPTDLAGLTADVASMFRSTAERAGLRFDVDVPSAPVTAMVDRAMFVDHRDQPAVQRGEVHGQGWSDDPADRR